MLKFAKIKKPKEIKLSHFLIISFYICLHSKNVQSEIEINNNLITVNTPVGKIEGQIKKGQSFHRNDYYSFIGIPYAKAPIGDLRFEAPVKLPPFEDTFKANTPHTCLQIYPNINDNDSMQGEEDCLNLNIYVPASKTSDLSKAKKPVLVFIHGGGFMFGSGYCHGVTYIIDKNLIAVTINYRLGIFGFLSSGDSILPGNNGMKDQVMALKWIQTNIASFGGDPDNVILTGLSAGGSSVHFHMLSPLSKGLFHKAISFSGVALNPWAIQEQPKEKYLKLAENLDCYERSSDITPKIIENIKTCLKNREADDIVKETQTFYKWYFNPFSPFAPVIDSWAKNKKGFMPVHPYKVLQEKKIVNDVPWITSMTTSEGLCPGADFVRDDFKLFHELDKNWNDVIHYVLHTEDVTVPKGLYLVNKNIRHKYFESEYNNVVPEIGELNAPFRKWSLEDFKTLIKLFSDRLFLADYDTTLRLHTNAALKPHVWSYIFNYSAEHVPSIAYMFQKNKRRYGVAHGDDYKMIFELENCGPQEPLRSGEDLKMTEFLLNMIETFAKTGKPGIHYWTPLKKNEDFNFLDIQNNNNIKMNIAKEFGRATYWRRLFLYENELYDLNSNYENLNRMLKQLKEKGINSDEAEDIETMFSPKNKIQKDEL